MAHGFRLKEVKPFFVAFIVINVVFLVLGLAFLVVVALMKSDVSSIEDEAKTVLNSLKSGDFGVADLAENLPTLFIVVGVFILLVSALGLVGACLKKKISLVLYTVLVSVLFVMKIVGISLWLTMEDDVMTNFHDQLVVSLHTNYKSDLISSGNDISNGWNMIFLSFDCCAVNNVTSTSNDFDNTPWCTTSGECQATNAEIPKACCEGVTQTNYTSAPSTCYYNMNVGSYKTLGCYKAIVDVVKHKITSNATSILVAGIFIFLVEIISVISAIILWKQLS